MGNAYRIGAKWDHEAKETSIHFISFTVDRNDRRKAKNKDAMKISRPFNIIRL